MQIFFLLSHEKSQFVVYELAEEPRPIPMKRRETKSDSTIIKCAVVL